MALHKIFSGEICDQKIWGRSWKIQNESNERRQQGERERCCATRNIAEWKLKKGKMASKRGKTKTGEEVSPSE